MSEDQKDISPRAEVLREAERLITGDRNETYGTPTQNFANIAKLWNVQFAHLLRDGAEFTAADVTLAQIHVKMGRMVAQPKRDNWVDLAGYAACGWECVPEKEPQAMTGVVPPRATGGTVFPSGTTPYTINITTNGMDAEEIAAATRAVTGMRKPVRDSLELDGEHECGPAC